MNRESFTSSDVLLDFFANLLRPYVGLQEAIFAKQAKQEMLRLDIVTPIVAGFIPREEYGAPRLFVISLKHRLTCRLVYDCDVVWGNGRSYLCRNHLNSDEWHLSSTIRRSVNPPRQPISVFRGIFKFVYRLMHVVL